MRPLKLSEIGQVSGGWLDLEACLQQYYCEYGDRGYNSEQPTPPPWWGICSASEWTAYVDAHRTDPNSIMYGSEGYGD